MTAPGRVVLLNGVGSVGKSSIAKALQKISDAPFLHVAMDAFIDMMPESLWGTAEGVSFNQVGRGGRPEIEIVTGPTAARVFRGMRHAIAALARQGNDVIVDDVLLGDDAAEYAEALRGLTVHWVGLHAPLDILEARERTRGDREIGLARWQYDRVHQGIRYDLELDTTEASPENCATQIKATFGL